MPKASAKKPQAAGGDAGTGGTGAGRRAAGGRGSRRTAACLIRRRSAARREPRPPNDSPFFSVSRTPHPTKPGPIGPAGGISAQEVCKVQRRRGQVHVFGRPLPGKMRLLAEKWTSPRTLQTSWMSARVGDFWKNAAIGALSLLLRGVTAVSEESGEKSGTGWGWSGSFLVHKSYNMVIMEESI